MQFFPTPKQTEATDPLAFFRGSGGREKNMPEFGPVLEAVRESTEQGARSDGKSRSEKATVVDNPPARSKAAAKDAGRKLDREDFAALKEILLEHGLSEEQVDELKDSMESGEGLTWKELAIRVTDILEQDAVARAPLDANEKRLLQGFLQQLGVLPQEAEALVDNVDSPEGQKALWQAIETALDTMGEETLVNVSAQDLSILGKALGMNKGAFRTLDKILSADPETPLLIEQREIPFLQRLLAGAGEAGEAVKQLLGEAGRAVALTAQELKGLKQVVSRGMADAGLLQKLFSAADGQKLDSEALRMVFGMVRQTQLRADVHADQNLKGLLQEIHDIWQGSMDRAEIRTQGKSDVVARSIAGNAQTRVVAAIKGDGAVSAAAAAFGQQVKDLTGKLHSVPEESSDGQTKGDTEGLTIARNRVLNGQSKGKGDLPGGRSASDGKADDDAVIEFWKKIEVRSGVKTDKSFNPQIIQAVADQSSGQVAIAGDKGAGGYSPQVSRAVLQTVQNGILQNLGQGRRQLTLQLNPPELGALTVMINVRNKDVQAVIRTGSEDAGRIVGEQLAQLRQSLEQQGLKVNRLEVQTQLKEDMAGQNWLGAEEHNQTWQQRQQFEGLGWVFKWLGMGRGEVADSAQELQPETAMEHFSPDRLDIFA